MLPKTDQIIRLQREERQHRTARTTTLATKCRGEAPSRRSIKPPQRYAADPSGASYTAWPRRRSPCPLTALVEEPAAALGGGAVGGRGVVRLERRQHGGRGTIGRRRRTTTTTAAAAAAAADGLGDAGANGGCGATKGEGRAGRVAGCLARRRPKPTRRAHFGRLEAVFNGLQLRFEAAPRQSARRKGGGGSQDAPVVGGRELLLRVLQ